jgi:catalase
MPEATHMLMWIMSDRAIPRSFRFMEGFGVHTFRLVNGEGKSTYVKFHWKPKHGLQSVAWNEAVKITRANYEPNSWPAAEGGPREDPASGFTSYPEEVAGPKRRLRPDSFADHYSQARQFYISQTPVERRHIAGAFTFELSKCDRKDIRIRMVAGLRNVDTELATAVAQGLGLRDLPAASSPTRTRTASSSPTQAVPRRCCSRPACEATHHPTAVLPASTTRRRPTSSPGAASCGSGTGWGPPPR